MTEQTQTPELGLQQKVAVLRRALKTDPRMIGHYMQPMGSYAIVRVIEPDDKSLGGVVLAEAAKQPQMIAEIIQVGPGQRSPWTGDRLPPSYAPGDIVVLASYSKTEAKIFGHLTAHMVAEGDIIAKIDIEALQDAVPADSAAPEEPQEVHQVNDTKVGVTMTAGGIAVVKSS